MTITTSLGTSVFAPSRKVPQLSKGLIPSERRHRKRVASRDQRQKGTSSGSYVNLWYKNDMLWKVWQLPIAEVSRLSTTGHKCKRRDDHVVDIIGLPDTEGVLVSRTGNPQDSGVQWGRDCWKPVGGDFCHDARRWLLGTNLQWLIRRNRCHVEPQSSFLRD
jgi:hypothetical protein